MEADGLIVGNPLDPQTDIGPMIAESEVDRVHSWVTEAKQSGAELLTGGIIIPNPSSPPPRFPASPLSDILQSYSPTVLFSPPDSVRVSTQEVFGPVICVYPFSELRDAISKANSLRYAFQAAIFTQNIDTAFEAAKKFNASAVMINDHTAFRVDWMPFGGRDESGIGTGGIPYTMREMTRKKLIVFKSKGLF
jgi:acyl-CoA reductase-like NAD-dependent aldehyde dehydrogenase